MKQDKFRGCLIGGAAGDALGYAVEFMETEEISLNYGAQGITQYDLKQGTARISDDTQMTLFTATGLLYGEAARRRGETEPYAHYIDFSYKDWLRTQRERYPLLKRSETSWLLSVSELFAARAPGDTCISAISYPYRGTIEEPLNRSKGCGGVMRVAPIGLFFTNDALPIEEIDHIGAEAAALTHGHSLGYIPAAGLVHIIHCLVHDGMTISEAVADMRNAIANQFRYDPHLKEFLNVIDLAVLLAKDSRTDDLRAIEQIGRGWVAEETLAIAIFCSMRYANDFDRAMVAAVNHGGDSDSTGAVTGNILGAHLGLKGIPEKYIEHLELKDVILEVADDLLYGSEMTGDAPSPDEKWASKYIHKTYKRAENAAVTT